MSAPDPDVIRLAASLDEAENTINHLRGRAAGLNVEVRKRNADIQDLEARNKDLAEQNDALRGRLSSLEDRLDALAGDEPDVVQGEVAGTDESAT